VKRGLVVLAVSALAALAYATGVLRPLDDRLTEVRFRLLPSPVSDDVVVVAIDPGSLRSLQVWPWPRGYHATVLENLLAADARLVAFDLDFSSRSIPDEDSALEEALRAASGRVVLPAFVQWDPTLSTATPLVETLPLPRFREHSRVASINVRPDADGLVRRYARGGWIGGRRIPSLAAALDRPEEAAGVPFFIDYGIDPTSISQLSYVDVLTGSFAAEQVRGKAVLVGATTVELGDYVAVPVHSALPGVLLQALAFESLRQNRALEKAGPALVITTTVALCLLAAPLILASSWRRALVALSFLAAGGPAASLLLQQRFALLWDSSPLMLSLAGCFVAGLLQRLDQQRLRLLLQNVLIRRKDVLIEQVMQNSFDAIFTLDGEGRVETANQAAAHMFRASAARLKGVDFDSLVRPRPGADGVSAAIRRDGKPFPVEAIVSQVAVDDKRLRVVLLRDVTERQAHQAALQHQATHDALTDLPNRILLQERMERSLAQAERDHGSLACLIIDLDRFKEVNDTLGHHAGDLLLKKIARRLERLLRPSDTIARIGGDEFAALLPDTGLAGARLVAERVVAALGRPFRLQNLTLDIGVSIGISLCPKHGREAASLLQRADVAMYIAKHEKIDYSVYEPSKDFHSVRNLTLMGDLKQALERDELVLFYQPKLSCRTEQVVGMEALVRWIHPRHGLLAPEEFIRLAETTGLIRPLSHWVLNAALRQCSHWHRVGRRYPVSVNLSVQNLREGELPKLLKELLSRWRLPPGSLSFEITESVIMEDPRRALEVVTSLSNLGVGISIDDFGTGYSSLSYLKRLPAREVKIDKTFVMEMDRNRDDAVIVRSIIEMAHNLGLEVVAEGVETAQVWRELRSLGCDYGQGHLFTMPLPVDRLQAWLDRWERREPVLSDSLPATVP
jgi:diguanylate cyclase (GGDEF)-like protein